MHLVGYLYEDDHDARSLEHKAIFHLLVNQFAALYGTRRFFNPLALICPLLCHNEKVHAPILFLEDLF
jgi:hypothetical protein